MDASTSASLRAWKAADRVRARVEPKMNMGVDQPGQQRGVAKINNHVYIGGCVSRGSPKGHRDNLGPSRTTTGSAFNVAGPVEEPGGP